MSNRIIFLAIIHNAKKKNDNEKSLPEPDKLTVSLASSTTTFSSSGSLDALRRHPTPHRPVLEQQQPSGFEGEDSQL